MQPPVSDDEAVEAAIEHKGQALTEDEQDDIHEHRKLRPLAVYEVIRREGVEELSRPTAGLWWSGLAAGLSIGFSVVAEGALHVALPDAPWRPLVENFGYAVGFLIVILARQQLFTEITLTAVLPIIYRPSRRKLLALARLWSVVFLANMAGTAMFAAACLTGLLLPEHILAGMLDVSRHLAELSPGEAFWRGIVAGWMIATLVWMLPSAETARSAVIVLMTYLIALFDLAHVVAGSMEIFMLVLAGELALLQALSGYILPMLCGNVIGGSALFALLAYGQVREELEVG
ncbi:formate/nitrite transporter family protein [Geminicoccus roseus]|uniref:formate/nitrite transporter family protein n=1 Tax=Geminicoccus roseus TaxID=404900 RepID=UPI000A053E7B|nr:formate/nitrite transporter family protein [Geminicoccus roseus]